jgi:hypothetical protein
MVNATSPSTTSYDVPAATLSFIRPSSNFNRRYVAPNEEINTGVYEDKTVVIRNAQPEQGKLTLEKNRFQLID